MHTVRLLILFLVVLFGAYAEHQAEKTVEKTKEEERKLMQYNSKIRHSGADFMKVDSLNAAGPGEEQVHQKPDTPQLQRIILQIPKASERSATTDAD